MAKVTRTAKGTASQIAGDSSLTKTSVAISDRASIIVAHSYNDGTGCTISGVAWGSVALAEIASQGKLKVFAAYGVPAATADVVVSYSVAPAASALFVLQLAGVDLPDPEDASAGASGNSATADSGYTGTPTHTEGFALGVIATEGPSTDTSGTWESDLSSAQRVGGNHGTYPTTVAEGVLVISNDNTAKKARKSGMTSRAWDALCIVFKSRAVLQQTLKPASGRADSFTMGSGGASTTNAATAAQMGDGSTTTHDDQQMVGDTIDPPSGEFYVHWTLGAATAGGVHDFVRATGQHRLVETTGVVDTSAYAVCGSGSVFGDGAAVGTSWDTVKSDAATIPGTGSALTNTNIDAKKWGWYVYCGGFTGNDDVTLETAEFSLEVWGPPALEVTPTALTLASSLPDPAISNSLADPAAVTLAATAGAIAVGPPVAPASFSLAASTPAITKEVGLRTVEPPALALAGATGHPAVGIADEVLAPHLLTLRLIPRTPGATYDKRVSDVTNSLSNAMLRCSRGSYHPITFPDPLGDGNLGTYRADGPVNCDDVPAPYWYRYATRFPLTYFHNGEWQDLMPDVVQVESITMMFACHVYVDGDQGGVNTDQQVYDNRVLATRVRYGVNGGDGSADPASGGLTSLVNLWVAEAEVALSKPLMWTEPAGSSLPNFTHGIVLSTGAITRDPHGNPWTRGTIHTLMASLELQADGGYATPSDQIQLVLQEAWIEVRGVEHPTFAEDVLAELVVLQEADTQVALGAPHRVEVLLSVGELNPHG